MATTISQDIMRDKRIYAMLFILVIWVLGSTYWIVTRLCPCSQENGNNPLSESYKPSNRNTELLSDLSDYMKVK